VSETINLEVPATLEALSTVRMVLGGLGARLDFSLEELEDLYLATDELLRAAIVAERLDRVAIAISLADDALLIATDALTSPEKGGRIVAPSEAMAALFYRETAGFRRLVLTGEEAGSLSATAVRALAAFNTGLRQKLRIAGVDLLLEVTDGKVRPVVLEINPRPSGLDKLAPFGPSHS